MLNFNSVMPRDEESERPNSLNSLVNVYNAPTIESAKLLRELEQHAEKRIVDTISVIDNTVNCVIHVLEEFVSDGYRFKVVFTMNGKKHIVDYIHHGDYDNEKIIPALIKKVSEKIAIELIQVSFGEAVRGLNLHRPGKFR